MSKRIMIDPGHAPGNVNGGKNGYKEYAGMWTLSNYLKAALERCGCAAALTRTENEDPSLSARGRKSAGYDLFISEHSNAANGAARGVEVYYSLKLAEDKSFAAALSKEVSGVMGSPDRGAKTKESTTTKGADYYTVIYEAQKAGAAHVLLIENGFHDNAQDEAFLLKDENLKTIAELQAKVICRYLGCTYVSPNTGDVMLSIEGQTIVLEAENINGRWYMVFPELGGIQVGVRDVLSAAGYEVTWEESSRTITAVKN